MPFVRTADLIASCRATRRQAQEMTLTIKSEIDKAVATLADLRASVIREDPAARYVSR